MSIEVLFVGVRCQSIYGSKVNEAMAFYEAFDSKIQISIENKLGEMLNFQGKKHLLEEWCKENDLEYFESERSFEFNDLFK